MPGEVLPNRQSIRKTGWDYTSAGYYFVTINTRKGRSLFGTVVNGRMVLNEAGRLAEQCWRDIPTHFPSVGMDEFVVMPNHLHGVLRLQKSGAPSPGEPHFGKPQAGSLGTIVGAYKAAVTREIQRRTGLEFQARSSEPVAAGASALWHRNYWDVIVRDETALDKIRNYIRFNPQNFDAVMQVDDPQFAGNRELLTLPKVGFLASRGEETPHGRLSLKSGEAIISGFLSPMERAVFAAGLKHRRPLIWVKPWGLSDETPQIRTALDENRLLILSPFSEELDVPSVRRAAWCNQYVLAHCDRLVIGNLNPDGMLNCILSESDPDKEIVYL